MCLDIALRPSASSLGVAACRLEELENARLQLLAIDIFWEKLSARTLSSIVSASTKLDVQH